MSTGTAIIIIIEAVAAMGLIWGWTNETKVKAWEQRVAREIRRRLCERWLNRGDLDVVVRYGR